MFCSRTLDTVKEHTTHFKAMDCSIFPQVMYLRIILWYLYFTSVFPFFSTLYTLLFKLSVRPLRCWQCRLTIDGGTKEMVDVVKSKCLACKQEVVFEPSQNQNVENTKADGQLACILCPYRRGNNSPYQQVAVVCIHHSKKWKLEGSGMRRYKVPNFSVKRK